MTPRRVLLVHSHDSTRHAMRDTCESLGWEAREAASAVGALALLDPPPALILVELELPDGRGETVVERVRADGLRMPVIAVSGNPWRMQDVVYAGASAVCGKDADLCCVLRQFLTSSLMHRGGEETSHPA